MVRVRRQAAQDRGLETQRAIIEGAAAAFDKAGYGNTSLADISEASGVSMGSMYFHFGTKEQLALAVINEQHARSLPVITAALERDTDPVTQLIAISRDIADQLISDNVVRAGIRLAIDEPVLREPAGPFYEDWVNGSAVMVQRALDAGTIATTLSPIELGRALIGFFTGTHIMSEATTGRADLMATLSVMWTVIIDAVVAPDHRQTAKDVAAQGFADKKPPRRSRR